MKRYGCHLTSTHLFLRIQHVLLIVILNLHWASEINIPLVARKSCEKIHVLQKWGHPSYWYIYALLVSAVGRLTLTSARSLRSLKCISPDNWNLVVDSFSRMKVSHVKDTQLLPCVQNCNTECNSFSESLVQGVWVQILYFTLESSLASFSHWVLFFWIQR